jgi:hypothetical protein
MNESFAITIMNDIINNAKNDGEILSRTQEWINMLHLHELNRLTQLYLSFIYEELIANNNNQRIAEVKNTIKEYLFNKPVETDISRYKAVIFTYMKYKKQNQSIIF